MAGTRFGFNINNKTLITVGQQIIYTGVNRGVEISYLNPFIPYFFSGLEDEEDGFPFDNDNTILFIDFKHEINLNMSLFGELLFDDIQIDNTGLDHAFGYKVGINKKFSFINKVFYTNFEWTEISPWAYIHNGQNTNE